MLPPADRLKLQGIFTLTMPLPGTGAGRNWLLARGYSDVYAALQAIYPEIPASVARRMQHKNQSHGADSRMIAIAVKQQQEAAQGKAAARRARAVTQLQNMSGDLDPAAKSALMGLLLEEIEADDDQQTAAAVSAVRLAVLWLLASDVGQLAWGMGEEKPFYSYAVSQQYIRAAASTCEVAELLLGPGAIEPEHLRWAAVGNAANYLCACKSADASIQ